MKYQRYSDGKMRDDYPHAFGADDLIALNRFLGEADAVVPVCEAATAGTNAVVLRHDVDHNLEHAVTFAEWEGRRGYRASYYVLPSAWYWSEPSTPALLHRLVELGHEVGIHQDCVAEAWVRGDRTPVDGSVLPAGNCDAAATILLDQIDELRNMGIPIFGTSTHGTPLWKSAQITNAFLWASGYTADDFGLQYADAYHLHRKAHYISDNRGGLSRSLGTDPDRRTDVLIHWAHWPVELVASARAA